MRENRKIPIVAVVLISLFIVACGKNSQTDRETGIDPEEASNMYYYDLYYADGFLYFTLEYHIYDEKNSAIRRLHKDVCRLKIGEDKAEILYSY